MELGSVHHFHQVKLLVLSLVMEKPEDGPLSLQTMWRFETTKALGFILFDNGKKQ